MLRKSHSLVHDDSEIVYGAQLIEHIPTQMTSLWNIRCHLDILRNCVTDSYFLDSPSQIRFQPHASCELDTHRYIIQQQLMTHTIKSL
jgi:hypothetical protein